MEHADDLSEAERIQGTVDMRMKEDLRIFFMNAFIKSENQIALKKRFDLWISFWKMATLQVMKDMRQILSCKRSKNKLRLIGRKMKI